MSRLIGGSALRARLRDLGRIGPDFAAEWADETADLMRQTKPPSDRPESSVFTTKADERHGRVFGAFWWIFVDRGTKAHGPKRANFLRFEKGGETIFARKVRGQKRRPFITRAAREALSSNSFADLVLRSWSGRKRRRFAR